MTESQTPPVVLALIRLLNACLQHHKQVCKRRAGFNADERAEWAWLADAIETPTIAAQFHDLDCDTRQYVSALMADYCDAVHPKVNDEPQQPTLFQEQVA